MLRLNRFKLLFIALLLLFAIPVLAQTNFTAGELSSDLYGRVDLAKYFNGCQTLENFLIKPQGPAVRRPGTYYVAGVKNHTKKVRLIPFEFSTTQAYILELGDEYMRFYMDEGQITNNTGIYEIVTPYQEADLMEIDYAQTADTMYLVHPTYPVYKLTRSAHTTWTLSAVSFTASPFGSADNYPSCVEFFEQRLFFANTNDDPQKIWSSKSGTYENMTTGALDDDALEYTIAASKVNAIEWMAAKDVLLMGTVGAEWRLGATSAIEPITPTNILCRRQSTYGSASVKPVTVGQTVLFLQRAERKVREFAYNFEQDIYLAPDMNLLAGHITKSGIIDMAYQQEPDSILWCVLRNGTLAAMTYQRDQEVVGWHRHITDGEVESVATIPSSATVNEDSEMDYMEYAGDDTAQAAYPVSGKEVDYFEYATDGAAQAAYVSSDADSGYSDDLIPAMTSYTAPSGVVSASSTHVSGELAWHAMDDTDGSTFWLSDAGGPWWLKYQFTSGKVIVKYTVRSSTTSNYYPVAFKLQGSTDDSNWDDLDAQTTQFFNDNEKKTYTFSNTTSYTYYRLLISVSAQGPYLTIGELELMGLLTPNLQCYSEDTIKQQGSYSLKCIAVQTDSLNDTLTRTVSPTVDLTGKETWIFYIYASRTGSNIKVGIHDSGGTTTESTPNVTSANTWQKVEVDISAVSDANKDAIDSIIITPVNADAANTFYLDNMRLDAGIQCYSEDTIIEQGTYSLKILTTKDASRDSFFTRTFTTVRNLSTDDKINLYVYAYRAGSNFKVGIESETTGVTTETDVTVDDTDTWQKVEWDISDVAVADKEDIKYFYITITDDDAADTIYIDDVLSRDEIRTTGEDQLWLSIKRNINGVVKRFVEYLMPQAFDSLEDSFFVDCGLSYDSTEATVFSGLDHLAGEEVAIMADGLKVDKQTVNSSGQITLTTAARKVHAGLPYTSKLQTMNLEVPSNEGSSQGKIKRITDIFIRMKDSVGGQVGYDDDHLTDISGTTLFNGDKRIPFPMGYQRDYYIELTQPDPLPMTIISLMPRIVVSN